MRIRERSAGSLLKTKEMKKNIITGIVIFAAFYLLSSFYYGTFNSNLWSIKAKALIGVCSLGIPLFLGFIDILERDKK